jgi:hypothetical protein
MTAAHMADLLIAARKCCIHRMYTDEAGAAFLVDRKRRTLRDWRDRGIGPDWKSVGRVLYDLEDLAKWLAVGGNKSLAADAVQRRAEAASGT